MTQDFDTYVEKHSLVQTDHDRVWWALEHPDERALGAATRIADEFPDLTIVGTESRMQMSDVQWQSIMDDEVIVMGFYPIRADKWTHEVIDEIREKIDP